MNLGNARLPALRPSAAASELDISRIEFDEQRSRLSLEQSSVQIGDEAPARAGSHLAPAGSGAIELSGQGETAATGAIRPQSAEQGQSIGGGPAAIVELARVRGAGVASEQRNETFR